MFLTRLRALFLASGICLAASCSRQPDASGAASAAALEQAGRWSEAAALWRAESLRLGPRAWEDSVKRAMADYLMAGDLAAAERFAAECLAASPRSHDVYFYLGDSQRVLMDYDGAHRTLERLLALRPDHWRAALAFGHVQARLGRSAEAIPWFERYLAQPAGAREMRSLAYVEWARALKRLGRKHEAADKLCTLLEAEPYHTIALSEAAQVFALLGKAELAKGLRAAHSWLFERGHQLSVEDESKVYSTGPTSEAGVVRLALQAADRREFLPALRQLEDLVAAQPGDAINAAALARLWLRLFRAHDALRVAKAAREQGARSADLCRLEAEASDLLGDSEAARKLTLEASQTIAAPGASRGDDRAFVLDTHWLAAQAVADDNDGGAAARLCLARIESVAPGDWRVDCGKARLELAAGRLPEALALIEQAVKKTPPGGQPAVELRRWLGVIRGLSGELKTAAREILALVKERPNDLDNFNAFERAFAAERDDPQVMQVLELKRKLESRRAARREAAQMVAAAPLTSSAAAYLTLGKHLAGEASEREAALDVLFLASELDVEATESLSRAVQLLSRPEDTFVRLRALRSMLIRAPGDAAALEALARAYLEIGARFDEAEALALQLAKARPGAENDELVRLIRHERDSRR